MSVSAAYQHRTCDRIGLVSGLSTNPLPAIYCPTEHLNKMILVPQRPSSESKGALYLAMSFLDFGSCKTQHLVRIRWLI